MMPAAVSGLSQALPPFSNAVSDSPQQEMRGSVAGTLAVSYEGKPVVDTVSLSDQSRQAATDVQKQVAVAGEAKKDADLKKEPPATLLNSSEKTGSNVAKVEFMYDAKGELVVKYMDTADRVVYQLPSELTLHIKETAPKSDAAVSTKA